MQVLHEANVVVRGLSVDFFSGAARRLRTRRNKKVISAVKDVSLTAYPGESIGILGRNGSGKSTLLKVIAGNLAPSKGEAWVSEAPSLLSVSAALQPDLSGRQNVRLGLLAKGIGVRVVREMEDRVAEWADIGDALDRPLGTYSTGMKARLKFSIATAIHSEILLVDEALSTGDAAFEQRAKDRMEGFLQNSGTVFIVSHSATLIKKHCRRSIWLHLGEIVSDGPTKRVLNDYERWSKVQANGNFEMAEKFVRQIQSNYQSPTIYFDSELADRLDVR